MEHDAITAIRAHIDNPQKPVLRRELLSWMNDTDIEVQGAAYTLFQKLGDTLRVDPPLEDADVLHFIQRYLERCFHEDPDGAWSHSRYAAGWELASWLGSLFDSGKVPEDVLKGLRDWLGGMYRAGSGAEREALVNATLEHLFERRSVRAFFRDWEKDPVLGTAFADAALWGEKGGDSPLVGRQKPKGRSRKK